MKLAIIGSRNFRNYEFLKRKIDEFIGLDRLGCYTIVSGGARGADTLARELAEEYQLKLIEYKAEWEKHGKRAGFLRNEDIIREADIVICFWDGSSSGTKHSINLAKKMRKATIIIYTDGIE